MTGAISAILLAAGESRRMGQPKLLLPWGATTVLGQVVSMFAAGLPEDPAMGNEILVVTGAWREQVQAVVASLAERYPVRAVHNPGHASGGMVSSIQAGLAALGQESQAALVGLGDQPQVRMETVKSLCAAFIRSGSPLVIPSYRGRRGHPWLAARQVWPALLALPLETTPRQFLNANSRQIEYVQADESILQDLDTPEEYERQRP